MTRIEKKFAQLKSEGRKAFIPYITSGDPTLEITLELVFALDKAGADLIELGVPFSDPIADGPVIQRATDRALKNGVTLHKVLQLGQNIRRKSEIPLVLFSYFNPLLNHGLEKLAKDAVSAGFDGILASDLTIEESELFVRTMRSAGLNTIFLVAPTSSPERMKKIAETSNGFVFAVGFGISQPEHVQAVWQEADGVIVGSSIVKKVEEHIGQAELVSKVAAFARWLAGGPDAE